MDTQNRDTEKEYLGPAETNRTGRVLAGLVLATAGGVLLADRLGADLPDWLFTWPMLLVVFGVFAGAKHMFRNFGWLVPVLIGLGFLSAELYPGFNAKPFIVPVLLITAGVFMALSRGRKWNKRCRNFAHYNQSLQPGPGSWEETNPGAEKKSNYLSTDDYLDITTVFGGVKKQLISKHFRGGEVTCVFAGAEINLSQTDIDGRVILELNNIIGGTKLTVPSNWHIQSELTTIMGGVEDNRNLHTASIDYSKTLVIKGTCFMGGITILSY